MICWSHLEIMRQNDYFYHDNTDYMLKVGLTGSIGSGKSTIAKVFTFLGIPVYFSDIEAKKILDQPDVIASVIAELGADLLASNGLIDRKSLASRVFNDHNALQWLNSLIHPQVRRHFIEWVESQKNSPYIMQESAIMLETGFSSFFDKIVVVTCPLEERINRVLYRDNMTRDQVLERMENQWSEELKVKKADLIIKNDDKSLALPQIIALHRIFLEMSEKMNEITSSGN